MHTRTGFQPSSIIDWYFSSRSRPELRTDRLITCHCTSMSRTFSTSRIHREVIHANGQSGSNQKSAVSREVVMTSFNYLSPGFIPVEPPAEVELPEVDDQGDGACRGGPGRRD